MDNLLEALRNRTTNFKGNLDELATEMVGLYENKTKMDGDKRPRRGEFDVSGLFDATQFPSVKLPKMDIFAYHQTRSLPGDPNSAAASPSDLQHWVVVGILMPIVIALYLLLIIVCYHLFCRKNRQQEVIDQIRQQQQQQQRVSQTSDETPTPPPSYAIFVGSGESQVHPPSYKMLFPPSYASIELIDETLIHNSSSSSSSNGLIPLNVVEETDDIVTLERGDATASSNISSSSNTRPRIPRSLTRGSTRASFRLSRSNSSSLVISTATLIDMASTSSQIHLLCETPARLNSQQQQQAHLPGDDDSVMKHLLMIDFTSRRQPSPRPPRQSIVPRCGSEDHLVSLAEEPDLESASSDLLSSVLLAEAAEMSRRASITRGNSF